jgi:diguanylate cyclase (GGDEF)-like protein
MRLPAWRAWTIVLAASAAATCFDWATGPQVNVIVLYLMIACFAAWCLGERVGILLGLAAVVMTGLLNGFGTAPGHVGPVHPAAMAWNTVGRILSMTLMVVLASGLRHALDQARWRASTDGLTGVLNKTAFSRRLDTLVTQAQRRGDSLVMAYIDLDGFKGVNDGYGHAAGDALLCRFAESAADAIRANDLFARIGGDEFIALLTVRDCANGDVAAERLHDRLTRILRDTGHQVTCSMGALVLDSRQVANPASLVEAADGLMYEVKHSGKNALRIARADLQVAARQEPFVPTPDRRQAPIPRTVSPVRSVA